MGSTQDNLHEQEELLFNEWKAAWKEASANADLFVKDGLIDEQAYQNSSPKLLFILKEVNGDDNGKGWDLRPFVKEGGRPRNYDPTWSNIARWVRGVRNLTDDLAWSSLREIPQDERAQILQSIAAVNMKKYPGGHTADEGEVARIAQQDSVFLKRQIQLYTPDITICCGTTGLYEWLVLEKPSWRSTLRGVEYCEPQPRKFVISYAHPAARVQDSLKYYSLIDAIREIWYAPR